ncbi:hypothetical protein DY000_02024742 [Brassica cretica]|uniref:Uncharacterized protein n=1 Tax=Brassica cretica TaxID=69181 RepID=A0ABQ7EI99_BRACR|nr:hypothetical protein DY000_02024742 [Brassica cretica]
MSRSSPREKTEKSKTEKSRNKLFSLVFSRGRRETVQREGATLGLLTEPRKPNLKSVKGLRVDIPCSGAIYSNVRVVHDQYSMSLFETQRDCVAGWNEVEFCLDNKSYDLVVVSFASYASSRSSSSNLGDVRDTANSGFTGGIEKWTEHCRPMGMNHRRGRDGVEFGSMEKRVVEVRRK